MSIFQRVVLTIIILGAINLGLWGLFSFDLVAFTFGDRTFITRFIYSLIGFFGLIGITIFAKRMTTTRR